MTSKHPLNEEFDTQMSGQKIIDGLREVLATTADLEKLVKPLVWLFWSDEILAGANANSLCGEYRIVSHPMANDHRLYLGSVFLKEGDYTDLKPYAQNDYATRIAAALNPDAVAAMVQEAVKAAQSDMVVIEPEHALTVARAILALIDKKENDK